MCVYIVCIYTVNQFGVRLRGAFPEISKSCGGILEFIPGVLEELSKRPVLIEDSPVFNQGGHVGVVPPDIKSRSIGVSSLVRRQIKLKKCVVMIGECNYII
jgi:hypothetical protein